MLRQVWICLLVVKLCVDEFAMTSTLTALALQLKGKTSALLLDPGVLGSVSEDNLFGHVIVNNGPLAVGDS